LDETFFGYFRSAPLPDERARIDLIEIHALPNPIPGERPSLLFAQRRKPVAILIERASLSVPD